MWQAAHVECERLFNRMCGVEAAIGVGHEIRGFPLSIVDDRDVVLLVSAA